MSLVTPGIGLIFWMLLSFSILLFILKKFAWKPILTSIKDREKSIEHALQAAETARNEMSKIKSDNQKILDEARKESESILKEAREMGETFKQEARKKADEQAVKIIEDARKQIEAEKQSAIEEMKNEIGKLSLEIAEKVLKTNLSSNSEQTKLINNMLNDIDLN